MLLEVRVFRHPYNYQRWLTLIIKMKVITVLSALLMLVHFILITTVWSEEHILFLPLKGMENLDYDAIYCAVPGAKCESC